MAAAGPAASVSSFASLGFGLASASEKSSADIMRGEGINAQDNFQADLADENAKFGRLQASLTDTTMREQLTKTLTNIDAIRASNNVDPSSPTTQAIEDFNRMQSDRQRTAAVVTARSQADYEEASGKYLRQAGQYAQVMASKSASADMFAGAAGFLGGLGKMAFA